MMIKSSATSTPEIEDEIDLLDLFVILAENIKPLVLIPLFAGITSFGLSFLLPKTYESQSILNPNKSDLSISSAVIASHIKSADMLALVGNKAGLDSNASHAKLIKKMDTLVRVNIGKQDQLITLTTQGGSPESAQNLNNLIWKFTLPYTAPRGSELKNLRDQLEKEKERLDSGLILETSTAKTLKNGNGGESSARLYSELLVANSDRLKIISKLNSKIEGLTLENLTQQPTLPELEIKPNKSLIAITSTLAAGILMLIFIFLQNFSKIAKNTPEQAEKIQRIRMALKFKK